LYRVCSVIIIIIMRSFRFCSHPQILADQAEEKRWVGHVVRMGEERKVCKWESLKERDHLEDHGVDRRMETEWILGRLAGGGVEWIQLAQDRGRLWAVVNAVMNLWVLAPRS
jgi:hypothetical protein